MHKLTQAALAIACLAASTVSSEALAAGTLTPVGSAQTMQITEHHVDVVLNNGFSRTEVTQTFFNSSAVDTDAVYEFPVPPDAALSEVIISVGERTLRGEVVGKTEAQAIYDEQNIAGETAGLATQQGYETFQFDIANVPAQGEARMTFVYYEKLGIDSAVGRYLYPLEDGGTRDEAETSFWTRDETVNGPFTFDLELKSAVPVEEVRIADASGYEVNRLSEGHYRVHLEADSRSLGQDVVLYYRLPDDLPGRIEVVPYRPETGGAGTFMMILTPGIDLAPLEHGKNYVFVLDSSGSMDTKIATLRSVLSESLSRLSENDRFRVVEFDDTARDISGGYQTATDSNIGAFVSSLESLLADGGTNLYDGLQLGLDGLETERATAIVLVTDGVANQGIVDPAQFDGLMRRCDARVFGLLMGNMANWPLMEIITEASGGFYAGVSNADDILGQVMLAQSKMTHEAIHDAVLSLSGVEVYDTTDFDFGKVYRGQQLIVLGRYAEGGAATVTLNARISGRPQTYSSSFQFPSADPDNPELERLWALDMIHAVEQQALLGLLPPSEAAERVRRLGIEYSLVTNETSMLVVDDAVFEEYGIDRNNLERSALEGAAQMRRSGTGTTDYRIDGDANAFPGRAPSLGSGNADDDYGGAMDPVTAALGALLGLGMLVRRRRDGFRSTEQ